MITELKKSEFQKCMTLIHEERHMEPQAVIEGINPGRIFVDDADSPTSGLIWLSNNDGFFFIGDEENKKFNSEINKFIDDIIVPVAKKQGLNAFEALGNHPGWYSTIEKLFHYRGLEKWNQKVYKLMQSSYRSTAEPVIDPDYQAVEITNGLYNDPHLKNREYLHDKISEFWNSTEEFLNTGMGIAILCDREIVSLCFSGFVVDNIHCVGIETAERHRGRQLAKKAAHLFVQECLGMGCTPYWDCMEENRPSVALAESLGFTNSFDYKGYYFYI